MANFETVMSHNHPSETLRKLNEFRESGGYRCDLTLVAEGHAEMPVHSLIMIACSDHFKALFDGEWKDSKQSRLELKELSANGLRAVIEFAYIGSLKLSYDTAQEVTEAASYLEIKEALALCVDFLGQSLTTRNFLEILEIAERHNLAKCLSEVRSFLLKNFDEIAKCDVLVNIRFELLDDILSEDTLCIRSEYTLFKIVLQWIEHDPEKRRPTAADLMRKIRFPLLSDEDLNEASKNSLMISDAECSRLLAEAREYQSDIHRQPLQQSPRTRLRNSGGHHQLVVHHGTQLQCLDFENKTTTGVPIRDFRIYRPCVCVIDNFLYMCGGSDAVIDGPATARSFRFYTRSDIWLELGAMNEARKDFVTVAIDRRLYAIGGRNANAVALNNVEQFDMTTNGWTMRSGLADAVYCHAGAVCSGRIYVSGGKKTCGCSRDFLSYDPGRDVWQDEPQMLSARCNHIMAAVNGILYVIGGYNEDAGGSPLPVPNIDMFDPGTREWSTCSRALTVYNASAAVMNDNVYVVGGSQGLKAVRYRIAPGEIQETAARDICPNSVTASCILQMSRDFPTE